MSRQCSFDWRFSVGGARLQVALPAALPTPGRAKSDILLAKRPLCRLAAATAALNAPNLDRFSSASAADRLSRLLYSFCRPVRQGRHLCEALQDSRPGHGFGSSEFNALLRSEPPMHIPSVGFLCSMHCSKAIRFTWKVSRPAGLPYTASR